jgi:hypothetical protein
MDEPVTHPSIYRSLNCKSNFKGKAYNQARVAPVSCTFKYKQLETCIQNVHYCSARPKPILPDPKTKQEGKVEMLDKSIQVKSLFLITWQKRRPNPNQLLPTLNPKQ